MLVINSTWNKKKFLIIFELINLIPMQLDALTYRCQLLHSVLKVKCWIRSQESLNVLNLFLPLLVIFKLRRQVRQHELIIRSGTRMDSLEVTLMCSFLMRIALISSFKDSFNSSKIIIIIYRLNNGTARL